MASRTDKGTSGAATFLSRFGPVPLAHAQTAETRGTTDLVGVDLLPTGPGGFCIVELNGAVDFTPTYSFPGRNVYEDGVGALTKTDRAVDVSELDAAAVARV